MAITRTKHKQLKASPSSKNKVAKIQFQLIPSHYNLNGNTKKSRKAITGFMNSYTPKPAKKYKKRSQN
jgi:hypothetical protein